MMPTKEALEVPNAIKDTTTPKTSAGAGHLRADAVSLDVPIRVHGTRVIEAKRGAVPQTEPFEETTSTMIVFPLGAVVKMETQVVGGQMVVLTNLKSGHDAICRIVKVRPYAQKHCYVEIEFTHRQPGYWGVQFASDSTAGASPIGPHVGAGNSHAAPPVSADMKIEKGHEADGDEKIWELAGSSLPKLNAVGMAAAPAVTLPSPIAAPSLSAPAPTLTSAPRPSKPESAFAPIGSQEKVQEAASATSTFGSDSFVRSERAAHVGETRGHAESAVGISESLPVAAEGGHALSQPAHVAPFGRFAAATNLGSGPAESVQDVVTSYLEARKHRPKLSPMLLGVAALVLTVVGGALFFYLGPFSSDVNAPVTAAPAFSPTAAHNLAPVSATPGANTAAPPTAVVAAAVPVRAPEPAPERVSKATVKEAPPPAAPVQEAAQPTAPVHVKAVKVPDMFGALNAHPVSPRRSSDVAGGESAPSIDAMSTSGPLKALASSTAPPSPISEMSAPEHTGGQLKPPRLVTSVLPVYPQIAQVAGVEGDVVVQASLDKDGNVSSTKVIYGPMMLRQAAVDALRRWKYEPAELDGKPVGTEMTVRIRFHR
jgi:protein TonB